MRRASLLFTMAMGAILAGCGGPKSVTATVAFNRMIEPKQTLSEQYMQIAVMDARMGGDTTEFDQAKWSELTAKMIQSYLESAATKHNIPIKLVDREHLKMTMGEKDLASAGVTDSGDNLGSAKVTGAKSILTSQVTVKIDKQVGKKRTVDAMSVIGGGWSHGGFGGGGASTEQVDEEARNITVQSQFQLKDAATNDIIVSHNAMPTQEYNKTKASPFFGSSKTEADMTPRDKVIGGMIELQAQEFLAKFVPMEISTTVEVTPSKSEKSNAAVRSMVTDDFESALNNFKEAISENADDYKSLFGAGVCCEKLSKIEDARKYYKLAQSLKPQEPKYREAVERINKVG
jgi:hypothetical protein